MTRLILLILLLCSPSYGAVTWGTSTNTSGTGNSVSFSHTVGAGANLVLGVCIATSDNLRTITVGPTFNGDAMTLHESITHEEAGADAGLFCYKLVNPDAGSSFTVAATISGTAESDDWGAVAFSASGVDQTTPFRAASEVADLLLNASSLDVTNSATGDIVVDIINVTIEGAENGTPAPHASQTSFWSVEGSGLSFGGSREAGASGTVTMSWTWTWGNQVTCHIAFAIQAATSAAVPTIVFTGDS